MQKTKIYIIVLILLNVITLRAQDTILLDLEKCRTMALENSKTIKIAAETVKKAQGEKAVARSAWLPNVSASATGIYKNIEMDGQTPEDLYLPTYVFDMSTGTMQPNVAVNPMTGEIITDPSGNPVFNMYTNIPSMEYDFTINGGVMTGVSVQQPLYAGGKIIAGNKMANIGENMAGNNQLLKESEIIYETDQVYYLYLSVMSKVELVKKYKELLSEVVEMVKDSYETGMVNRNELLKVQVKYNEASLQLQKAESGLKLARMSLCRIIGMPLNSEINVNDSIGNISFKTAELNSPNAANRIEYQLLQGQVELARENVKLVRGDYLPTAGVSLSYNYTLIGIKGSIAGMMDIDNFTNKGGMAMGSLQIPITNFGERKGKVSVAKADYAIKQLELEQAEAYLQLEIEQARLNYTDAFTRVQMAEEALKQAEENMRISNDNYSLGMETIVNLLEAKAEWQKAYSDKIDALTEFKVQESNLLRVSNTLKVQ